MYLKISYFDILFDNQPYLLFPMFFYVDFGNSSSKISTNVTMKSDLICILPMYYLNSLRLNFGVDIKKSNK